MLRHRLDLFAHVIHAKSIEGLETRHKNVDLIVVRQNTEGEYSGLEHEVGILTFLFDKCSHTILFADGTGCC
jgi:isocitrate/isopropylmalate dehydrogenase